MIHVVLYEPEIPPNTGNIIRLCVNSGATLHLIHPLGFELDDTKLQRAGLDYREWANIREHESIDAFIEQINPTHVYAISTRGKRAYNEVEYTGNTALLFGPETRGLPTSILESLPEENILRIPMQDNSRSINLSNAVAIIVYEAWRQMGFKNNG
ncbi:MAG: tRNA (uridine(34)/cytosine(34)/5-carboxymethylaminomethyluridine(34)-2'-O)-methyltransferase TrmL [Gammaproteobacteria bacterium]